MLPHELTEIVLEYSVRDRMDKMLNYMLVCRNWYRAILSTSIYHAISSVIANISIADDIISQLKPNYYKYNKKLARQLRHELYPIYDSEVMAGSDLVIGVETYMGHRDLYLRGGRWHILDNNEYVTGYSNIHQCFEHDFGNKDDATEYTNVLMKYAPLFKTFDK